MPNSHYGNTFIEFASYNELIIEYENAHFRKIVIFASGEKEFIEDKNNTSKLNTENVKTPSVTSFKLKIRINKTFCN